jgi:hypothetical protein
MLDASAQGASFLPSLVRILSDPDTSLEDVLEHPALAEGLRQNVDSLMSYLLDSDNLQALGQYALSDEYRDDFPTFRAFRKVQHSAVSVLASPQLQRRLQQDPTFVDLLISVQNGAELSDRLAANFSQIIMSVIVATGGRCVQDFFSNLGAFLLTRLRVCAYRDLYASLATRFGQLVNFSAIGIQNALRNQTVDPHWTILTFREILIRSNSMVRLFESREVLLAVFEVGLAALRVNDLLAIDAFRLLKQIFGLSADPALRERISGQADRIRLNPITIAALGVLELFPQKVEQVIHQFFEEHNATMFNQSVYQALAQLQPEVLCRMVPGHKLFEKIVAGFEPYVARKTNGHFLAVAQLIIETWTQTGRELSEEMRQFAEKKIRPRRELIDAQPTGFDGQEGVRIEPNRGLLD